MKSNKIFIEDWLKNKPYNNHNSIDIEYLTISNKIYKKFDEYFSIFDTLDVTRQEMKDLAVFLSAYLEDLVSDTQIWNAFISIHKREYKKPLPFYEESNYTDEEVNKIDIQFLIWYYFNITNPERFLSPYDEYLNVLAGEVFEILNNEYEYVSENEILKQHYLLKPNSDFYETRSTIQKILFESYLFGIDSKTKLNEKIIDSFSEKNQLEKNEQLRLINSITDSHTHSYRTKLLAYKGKDWLSEIIGKEHNLFNSVKNISDKISSWFLYKGQTTTHIQIGRAHV